LDVPDKFIVPLIADHQLAKENVKGQVLKTAEKNSRTIKCTPNKAFGAVRLRFYRRFQPV
jgi:hypothetical protein